MSTTDPIADMLTRIRNAVAVRKNWVVIPASRLKKALAQVLIDEGYVARVEEVQSGRFPALKMYLKYGENDAPVLSSLKRISKPGCRVYVKRGEIPWVRSGFGTVIMSTPRGVVTGREARRLGVGGEVLCEVW
jgi:small subunit ribosomal protein S8